MQRIVLTISDGIDISPKRIASLIEGSLLPKQEIEVTVTPETIDIRKARGYSEIALTGSTFAALEAIAKEKDIPIEQVLRMGAERLARKERNGS